MAILAETFFLLIDLACLATAVPDAVSYLSAEGAATAYCSNADMTMMLRPIVGPVQGSGVSNGTQTWNLIVDDTQSGWKQSVVGFGAAVTDATVASMNTMTSNDLTMLLNELMTSGGANFNMMRHTIGSSDMSADPAYSYDNNSGQVDPSLSGFNLGDRGTAMAGLMAHMRSINPEVFILGSSWSAPGWMKLNGVLDGTTVNNNLNDGFVGGNLPFYSDQFAQYFVKYLQAYKDLGVYIDAITIQNEPYNSQAGYPTMYVFGNESGFLINNHMAPALKNAGIETEIWAWDHNTAHPEYPEAVMIDTNFLVDTVAWHCYDDPGIPHDWNVLTDFHNKYPEAKQYMTECWTPDPSTPYYAWNQAANFTISSLQNWASGAMAWTLAGNSSNGPYLSSGGCQGACQGLVTVNNDGGYSLNVHYFMMAQVSKFIPPGAMILNGAGSWSFASGGIKSVASLNPDSTRTVIIMNTFTDDRYIQLKTRSGEQWSGNIPHESVVTWVLPAALSANKEEV